MLTEINLGKLDWLCAKLKCVYLKFPCAPKAIGMVNNTIWHEL